LFDRLHAYRVDVGAAGGFEQRTGVGGIGLVALDVGADVGGGEQADADALRAEVSCPVVGATAGFHDDEVDLAVVEPALELSAGEAMRGDRLPGAIGDGELKDVLSEVDGDDGGGDGHSGSRIHHGLPLIGADTHRKWGQLAR